MFRVQLAVVALAALGFASGAEASPVLFKATLNGANEVVPNASLGTGTASVTFDIAAHTMRVQVQYQDLTYPVAGAHIHCCAASPFQSTPGFPVATAVPVFPGFVTGLTAGSYDQVLDMTLPSSYNPTFVTNHGNSIAQAEQDLYDAMLDGKTYLNLHSPAGTPYTGGEIRGFLVAVPEPATLALFGFGLLGLGFMIRRRRAVPA